MVWNQNIVSFMSVEKTFFEYGLHFYKLYCIKCYFSIVL